ncbi:MAG: M42 family metallopeptidase [Candidatus Cloacimonetes bacterium]|nr:M42 family metallopeptidase [Candidatus Cloacimonadota bacterium]
MNTLEAYVNYSVESILKLCRIPSPSGFTKEIGDFLTLELAGMKLHPEKTRKNAVICELGGVGRPLVLAAHIDTLGAMIRSIKGNGRIRFTPIGGYAGGFVENENVCIHTREGKKFSGTIHLINAAAHTYKDTATLERNEANLEIVIDEVVTKEDETLKLGIKPGDFISFDPRTIYTESGFIKSRFLDDKASAGVLMGLAKAVSEGFIIPQRKVYLMFTNYEEVGHGASSGIPADVEEVISVDMGAVGDDLKTDEYKVSICAKDSGGPYDYDLTNKLIEIAEREKLNFAVDIYPYYGSDVEATLRAGYDIRHGLIGPGVFASHSYERTHKQGVENTFKLLQHYIIEA